MVRDVGGPPARGGPSSTPPSHHQPHRGERASKARGEVAELKVALASFAASGRTAADGGAAKREVFKKLVHYMTIGIDMSPLFMQVIAAAAPSSNDVLLKKMLYWYVATYARANPELTLLTINLLTRDCSQSTSPDPSVRALALRALCGLRVRNLVEYATPAVTNCLKDPHPAVRKAAVVAVLKILHVDPAAVASAGWIGVLDKMLPPQADEPDAAVAANALAVLRAAGSLPSPPPRATIVPLLNRIREFSEWGQCLVMEVAAGGGGVSVEDDGEGPSTGTNGGFVPRDDDEAFALLEVLDDRLSSNNSAVVLAAAKLFLHLTLSMPETHQRVLERLKGALLLVAGGECPETAAAALAHLRLLAERAPPLFASAASALYPRRDDTPCVRSAKLATLVAVADEGNVHDIAAELAAESLDLSDSAAARAAVAALGGVAAAVPSAPGVAERLLGIVEATAASAALASTCSTSSYSSSSASSLTEDEKRHRGVLAECIIQAAALARRAPGAAAIVVAALAGGGNACSSSQDGGSSSLALRPRDVDDASGRASYVWLLGEHGAHLKATPYELEALADSWTTQPREVKSALLRAAVRLFYRDGADFSPSRRAAEVAPLLRKVLAAGASDADGRVRDTAMLYARAIGGGATSTTTSSSAAAASLAEAASCPPAPPPDGGRWPEDAPSDVADVVFAEFNTLAVLYRAPMSTFAGGGGGGFDLGGASSSASRAQPLPSLLGDEDEEATPTTAAAPLGPLLVADLLDVSSAAASPTEDAIDEGSSLLSSLAGGGGSGSGSASAADLEALSASPPLGGRSGGVAPASPSTTSTFSAPVLPPETSSVDPFAADPFGSSGTTAAPAAAAAAADPFDLLGGEGSAAPPSAAAPPVAPLGSSPGGGGGTDDPFGLGDLVAALSSSSPSGSSSNQQRQPF